MKLDKVLSIVLWVLLAVSAALLVSMMMNISDDETDAAMGAWINTNLTWTYILLFIGAAVAVIAGIFQTFTDKEAAKKGAISIVFVVIVIAVSYAIASDAIPSFYGVQKFVDDGTLTPTISKWVGTTLYATYILLGLTILGVIASSVSRAFK